jgi:hypothetical protein
MNSIDVLNSMLKKAGIVSVGFVEYIPDQENVTAV